MRIAVAYQDGEIGEHFGHAKLFAIYDYAEADVNRCTKKLVETGDRHGHQAMAELMHLPVIGLVENMSYFKCPDCGKEHAIFGESKVAAVAESFGIEHYARLPIDPVVATMVDAGEVESIPGEHLAGLVDYMEKEL